MGELWQFFEYQIYYNQVLIISFEFGRIGYGYYQCTLENLAMAI